MEPSDLNIRTCPRCKVDVSVPSQLAAAACPKCDGPLEVPVDPEGDAPAHTLLEMRSEAATQLEIKSTSSSPPSGKVSPTGGRAPLSPDEETEEERGRSPHSETATFRAMPSTPNRRMGNYELRRVLGKGGMGIVYEAFQPALGRTVALKVISSEQASEEEFLRFQREARAAAKLKHPNIVPIHEVGSHEGRQFFTMDLVHGRTLTELARSNALRPEDSAQIIAKVAKAIHYAHEQQIIHRDIKPSNILVDANDEPHVMDFGLAKDLSEVSGLTLTGVAMGSPPYMPPEQARGDFREVDTISDVYGLGATLYECLAGRPPFKGKSLYDVIAKVLVEDPTPPRKLNPAVPYDLETICLKALEKEKWRRYPSAEDMARDIERHLAGRTIHAARQGFTTRFGRVLERHKLQIFSVLIPVSVLAALGAYTFGAPSKHDAAAARHSEVRRKRGPIAQAAESLAGGEGGALRALLGMAPRLPTWEALELELRAFPATAPVRKELRRSLKDLPSETLTSEELPPGDLAKLIQKLIDDPDIDAGTLSRTVDAWVAPADPELAELVRRATLTLRGALVRTDPEPFRLALREPLTPLDWSILHCAGEVLHHNTPSPERFRTATEELCDSKAPQRALIEVRSPPEQSPASGRIRAYNTDGSERWSFPPVRLPGEREDPSAPPLVRGLITPGHDLDLRPTVALVDISGARVVVGWLRFLYVLDLETGRLLQRARLPGLAKALEYTVSGDFRVEAAEGDLADRYLVSLDDSSRLRLRDAAGRPLAPLALVPGRADAVPNQLYRVAAALLPEFDDLIELYELVPKKEQGGERGSRRLLQQIRARPPPKDIVEVGILQPGRDLCLSPPGAERDAAHGVCVISAITVGSNADLAEIDPGDLLLDVRAPEDMAGLLRVTVRRTRPMALRRGRLDFTFHPWRLREPARWRESAERGERLLETSDDPNPWLEAFVAAALAWSEPSVEDTDRLHILAEAAATSPHLAPHERVELACFLDRLGAEDPADKAFQLALSTLVEDCGFLPEWAGYGPLDSGRVVALRVEELWLEGRGDRALTLTRWRNAFAPVLVESEFATKTYVRIGADPSAHVIPQGLATPPPALAMDGAPPKGIGGFQALSLQRLDHAIRLQGWFLVAICGLLLIAFVRYRRHAVRLLERIGVHGFWAQQALWLKRPWVRMRYSWPMFLTLNDKLSFVVLYLVFFGVFAFQDAGLGALAAHSRAPQTLLAGLPNHPESLYWLGVDYAQDPRPERAYTIAWVRAQRGLSPLPALLDALRASSAPRDHLLLAEILLSTQDVQEDPEPHLELAAAEADLRDFVAYLRARRGDDTARMLALEPALTKSSIRLALALEVCGELPQPLSPAPRIEDRDRLLLGADAWWKRFPALLLRNLVQPWPEQMDASITEFETTYRWNMELSRLRNDWFFLVPGSLVLLIASLFMPSVHIFEPLESDLTPPFMVRILSLLAPGMPQFMRGRPVRAVLLLLPLLYGAQTLLQVGGRGATPHLPGFGTNLSPIQMAGLTAENIMALESIRVQHYVEVTLFLLVIYVLHWIDLALTQRKVYRAGPGPSQERLIIPVDSIGSAPSPELREATWAEERTHETALDPQGSQARVAGPFDVTERDLPARPAQRPQALQPRSESDVLEPDETRLDADSDEVQLRKTPRDERSPGDEPFSDSNPGDADFE